MKNKPVVIITMLFITSQKFLNLNYATFNSNKLV
jgi:hypothetical protein